MKSKIILLGLLVVSLQIVCVYSATITANVSGMNADITNGYYTLHLKSGYGTSLVIGGKELIGPAKGFYCSINGGTGFSPTKLTVVSNTASFVDLSYTSDWGELHFVARSDVNGIYSYFVATGIGNVGEFRTLYRMDGSVFRNGYNAERSGGFPTAAEIDAGTSLQDETWQLANGQVYTKYDWSTYWADDTVHGVYGNGHGVWMISPSKEYIMGPLKQDLQVQGGAEAIALNYLVSGHYGTPSVTIPNGKFYGPWLVYFNDGSSSDAESRYKTELAAWPYSWVNNAHYPTSRTTVTGTLKLSDGRAGAGAMVVLAKNADLFAQGADYEFWSKADSSGGFSIPYVRSGSYNLYAYADGGAIGDVVEQLNHNSVSVSGTTLNVGTITWTVTKYSASLWQIGTSDRKTKEYKLGNVNRAYANYKSVPADLTYTIGSSKPADNWYYAQTKVGTWTVSFSLSQTYSGTAKLTIAKAGQSRAATVTVSVNGKSIGNVPTNDNDMTIYRSGNRGGYYHLQALTFAATELKSGANTITFHATKVDDGGGMLYDTIKLDIE